MSMEKGIVSNPISNYDDVMTEIAFCYDLGQFIRAGACCHDCSCAYAACCKILRDSVRGKVVRS